ncbi:hypothetical protein I79_002695 [Cricetulus griseus]|uniref:Uncharacterized protein n=1 Tax=Cricetulus griseus TaxID=10029 RepID=G3GY40_CRIGR|nr:hypothetical protein I79_002695 [Cricetulus griseus]
MGVLKGKGRASAAEGQAPGFPGQLLGAKPWSRFFRDSPFEDLLPFSFSTEEPEAQRDALTSAGRLARKEPSMSCLPSI